ncbi:hypothetical protein ABI_44330 [Asticcacaulis biprosthecium C19]|uniref:Alpha/beta hydrolase family protein n=1 Tax=Asticcacaulis biprosthecium C19 TaxID=715226 RepID=F4QTD6_9CAUL|nr:hypothetical protein [Asticcacaulis biprosthecium]EGF90006.1 hypothetical protein ABI_44330 [Asticcacaulis biprosthecium C19]
MITTLKSTLMIALAAAGMAGHAAAESGPYKVVVEEDPTLPEHVVYRPADINGVKSGALPVYVFGNGACSHDGTSSRNHLAEIASHGYLVVAPGIIPANHPAPAEEQRQPGQLKASNSAESLTQAIDWALKENGRSDSRYYGRVAADKVAASGFSCGGLQAISVARDPRISTVVVMNSGVFNDGNPIAGINVSKAMLADLHGSVIYVLGGPTDIAYNNGRDDYKRINHIPAAYVDIPVGHGGTYMEPNGGIGAEIVTAWLDWKLKGDASAADKFSGESCGYCVDKRIIYEKKNF